MADPTKDPEELLSAEQIAAEFRRSESIVWRWAKQHGWPRYTVPMRGRLTLFRRADV